MATESISSIFNKWYNGVNKSTVTSMLTDLKNSLSAPGITASQATSLINTYNTWAKSNMGTRGGPAQVPASVIVTINNPPTIAQTSETPEPDVGDTGPRTGGDTPPPPPSPPPHVEPDVGDTGSRDTVYSKQDLKNIVSLYDDPRFDDDERKELIANIENNSITTPTQVINYANYYISHDSTGHGGGPGGGDHNPPVYRPPVDTRSTEQKQADFYKAAQSASDNAALGDSTQLRNFDKFFHIDRPENEYSANFQKAAMGFSEGAYLKANPDVAQAVADGTIESGLAHYISSGRTEGRNGNFTPEGFNEEAYLAANPDVAAAVTDGQFASGLDHYLQFGWNVPERNNTWLEGTFSPDEAGVVAVAGSSGSGDISGDGSDAADDTTIRDAKKREETPLSGSQTSSDSTDTAIFAGGSATFDENTGQESETTPNDGGDASQKSSFVRNDEDSGFAYPWSAAQSTGSSDIKGTIAKAVAFLNDNDGKDYIYDDVKGTIISKSTGSFMSRKDTQALNHVIVDYYKQDFKLPGGNNLSSSGGGIESGSTQFYTPNGVGAAKIDSNNNGLPTVGDGAGVIAGAAPVRTDGGTVPLP